MNPAVDPEAETGETRVVAGRYQVRRALGSGGMGVVYEAENTWTRRRVALKVLPADRTADPMAVERFMREARTAASLRHPNVVDVLDMGQDPADGSLFIVQELLEGEDLRALLAREGPLDERRARALIAPALRGLAAAHAAGVVHRDVKPANLFLARGPEGEEAIKVIDFGIAREAEVDTRNRTGTGVTVGTPAYMAPEQLRAEKSVGPAADVWAVGVVLHEMLTGDTPFPSDNYNVLVHRVLSGDPPPLDTTLAAAPTLRPVIARCLAHDPAARFPDAAAVLAALPPPAPPPAPPTPAPEVSPAPKAPAPAPRRAWPVALAASAVALTAIAVVATAARGPAPLPRPRPRPSPCSARRPHPARPSPPRRPTPRPRSPRRRARRRRARRRAHGAARRRPPAPGPPPAAPRRARRRRARRAPGLRRHETGPRHPHQRARGGTAWPAQRTFPVTPHRTAKHLEFQS
ncbi:MAG: serine/threonine-protein kinase [Polyangiales bacterium]